MSRRAYQPNGGRWARFNAVGVAGAAVQLASLWLLRRVVGLHYLIATAVAIELAVGHNFAWHIGWTWADRPIQRSRLVRRFMWFNATNGVISIAGSLVLTAFLVEYGGVHYLAANLTSIVACSFVNFAVSDLVVFKPVLCAGLIWLAASAPLIAADLQRAAAESFDRYSRVTEARLDQELRGQLPFLWLDRLDSAKRLDLENRIRRGEIGLTRLEIREDGRSVRFPGALCHHWIGTMLVPHLGLERVVTLMQSYERYEDMYRPAVRHSRTLSRTDSNFIVLLQLFQKKVISVVLNTESEVSYLPAGQKRVQVRSRSTRIAEVTQPDTPDEREKPIGHDGGFLWRFNNYCALEEREPGTYVQCETLSLSRDIPIGLSWLIAPFVTSVPRESLEFTLRSLRNAVTTSAR